MKKEELKNPERYSPGRILKITALIIIFLFSGFKLKAQFYEYGQPPPSLEWKKIESEHFTLIYPEEIKHDANRLLILLEKNYYRSGDQLNNNPDKVPVILHNHTVRSNGFVVWAPKRMEMFMHPDVDPISQDWLTHLSLHEFRHVVQVDKLNQGITKVLTTVLGEQGIGPAAGMVPFWFYEGDAIYAETSLGKSGRGRSPRFEMRLKAHLLEDERIFSFSEAYLGSYKKYVPDYYQFGYQMVSYARKNYGEDFWTDALNYTGRNIFIIDPMYFYLKRETGKGKAGLYESSMHYIKNHWEEQREKRKVTEYEPVNKKRKLYTSYKSPQITKEKTIIAVRSGLDLLDRIVLIDSTGNEELLHVPGRLYSGRISYSNKKIIWDEYVPDIRWTNKSSSEILEYDMETGRTRKLTRNGRYSSPSFSPSGDTILSIETSLANEYHLVFLNSYDGTELSRVPSPGNIQLLDPAWLQNNDRIVAIGLDEKGKQLLQYDRSENNWERLLLTEEINISYPVSAGNYILFNGSFNGLDNIFAYHLDSKKIYTLTHSEFGAFQPDVSQDLVFFAFAVYSANGYHVVMKELEEDKFTLLERKAITEQTFFRYGDEVPEYETLIEPESDELPEEEKYKGPGRLFNFHSWSPFYFDYSDPDLENPAINPGITLLSQNLLSTAITSLGYEYKDGDHFFHTKFTYKGWLPVFDISYTFGGLPSVVQYEEVPQPEKVSTASNLSVKSYIPLNFYHGKWISGLQPSLKLSYSNDYFYYVDQSNYLKGITYTEPRLYLYSYQRRALRDLQPRFGIILDLNSIAAPFEDEQRGSNSSLKTTLYLPGIIRGQGLRLKAEWQRQKPERYLFGNTVSFARGYEPLIATELSKYSVDYRMPLLYPDLALDGFLYIKRIRANLFADYLYGKEMRIRTEDGLRLESGNYISSGAELNFDYHLLRLLIPFSSGVRASYLNNTGEYRFEFLFNVYVNRF
ncbi:MAG: hypothetical protein ACOCWA_04330 [Bacteroidota bacterium]